MRPNQRIILPLIIEYQGGMFQIKALKCTSSSNEILYKIALPSSLCTVPVCWINGNGTQWELALGVLPDENLKNALITAISKLEEMPKLIPVKNLSAQVSA